MIKVALAISLALNLAVAGMVAGTVLRARGPDGGHSLAVRDLNFGPFTEALTREQRRAMLRGFAAEGNGLRAMRAEMRADFDNVLAVLRGTPFDAAALQSAFDAQNRKLTDRVNTGRKALVDLIIAMTDAERAEFTKRLEDALSHRRPALRDGNRN